MKYCPLFIVAWNVKWGIINPPHIERSTKITCLRQCLPLSCCNTQTTTDFGCWVSIYLMIPDSSFTLWIYRTGLTVTSLWVCRESLMFTSGLGGTFNRHTAYVTFLLEWNITDTLLCHEVYTFALTPKWLDRFNILNFQSLDWMGNLNIEPVFKSSWVFVITSGRREGRNIIVLICVWFLVHIWKQFWPLSII